jgi:hypothetical protein
MRTFVTAQFPNYDNPGIEDGEDYEVYLDELYELQLHIDHEDDHQLRDTVCFLVEHLLSVGVNQFFLSISKREYSYL